MKYFSHILRVIVGVVFMVSGLSKLFPIEPFEIIFVDLGISNFFFAPFIARGIIAFEIFLGLCIVFNSWHKNLIYKLTLASLALFTVYLIYLLLTVGNDVDCGCFGSLLSLTPLESILKNLLLVVILLFMKRRFHVTGIWENLPFAFLVIAFSSAFLLNGVGLHNLQGIEVNEKVDYSALPMLYKEGEKVDFSQGKKMIAFLSNSCSHCLNAARIFSSVSKDQDVSNLYFIVGARTDNSLNTFLNKWDNKTPVIWIEGNDFFKYSGGRLPAIVYLEDGVIKKKWFGDLFDVEEVKSYLH